MADAWVRRGVNPDDPDEAVPVVAVDPERSPGERLVAGMGNWGYEGDGVMYIVRTDGWIHLRSEGGELVAEAYIHEHYVSDQGGDPADYPVRWPHAPQFARVLRATGQDAAVGPEDGIAVLTAPHGADPDAVLAGLEEDDWPLIWAPPPTPEELAADAS